MIIGEVLIVHTIYKDPEDFPGMYVGRGHRLLHGVVRQEDQPFAVAATLEEVRAAVPPGSDHCLGRLPEDDPCIVESWV